MIPLLAYQRIAAFQELAVQVDILFASGRIDADRRRDLLASARDETGMTTTQAFRAGRYDVPAQDEVLLLARRDRTNVRRRENHRKRYQAQRAAANATQEA